MQLAEIREHIMAVVAPDLIRLLAQVTRVFAGTEVAAEAENTNLVSVLDLDEHGYLVAISGIVLQSSCDVTGRRNSRGIVAWSSARKTLALVPGSSRSQPR